MSIPLVKKYRPTSLNDVVGQPVVVRGLKNAFKVGNLHHAYILAGKFGCGKTSIARIMAAMINCVDGPSENPCGKCKNCKEIFSGKSYEVNEMDAASNRGIDDIRQLHKSLYTCPINYRKKIVIIDEAHSLTGTAAEAALKMIEEPPEHVMFFLVTTDPHLLKDTIQSRCIMWKLNSVNWLDIFNHLKNIADKENIEYEDESLKVAARAAKGSVRNSLQNLQIILDYSGDKIIGEKAAKEALGVVEQKAYFEFIDALLEGDSQKGFKCINNILRDGKESGVVVNDLYAHLHNLMLARIAPDSLGFFGLTDEEIKQYTYQTNKIVQGQFILNLMENLSTVSRDLKLNFDIQYLLNRYFVKGIVLLVMSKKDKGKNKK